MTHTFAAMAVSPEAWDEIHGKLRKAAYDHAILVRDDGTKTLDMHGIGLVRKTDAEMHDENFRSATRSEQLERVIREMIDELVAVYDQEYSRRNVYPHLMVRYNRDMGVVERARVLLREGK